MSPRAAAKLPGRITLLTDFGTRDGYVAAMRGVIASIAPKVLVEDASHDVPAGDVTAAAWALGNYWRLYPAGTVHVAVVDPGVGTERRALAAGIAGHFFVAPDNGVLTRVLVDAGPGHLVSITEPAYLRDVVSRTFHGRDVFAPVAAHLATGVALESFGPPVTDPVRLDVLVPTRTGNVIRGQVVHVDRFGNLITNVPGDWIPPGARVRFAATDLGAVRQTYGDVATGHAVAVIGSAGYLEIGIRDGDAARVLWKGRGTAVVIDG
ncbi:MAG: SAM-dependent chlorinase/fluorinase [Gemmatimonadetes bacterium]|nr:SAM-dependent chlorinase/fluorinase [Gemmatimonadota bacterium]